MRWRPLIFFLSTLGTFAGCGKKIYFENEHTGEFRVDATRYGDGQSEKALIIVPPTGGTNIIDRWYAKRFNWAGFDVYILDSWTAQNEISSDLEIHQRFYTGAQQAIKLTLAGIPSHFVGLLGTSVGALHASIAANTIARIDAVFLIVGGTPIADVIVGSDQKAMLELRQARKARFNFSRDQEQIEAIGHVFTLEPMDQGELFKTKDIGMAIADEDTTVPVEKQKTLKAFFRPNTVFHLPNNHFWGIVNTCLFHTEELVQFFENSFKNRKSKLK